MADTRLLPAARTENWDWQRHAACRDTPTATFFHPDYERGHNRRQRENNAKALCARCPVRAACLHHALSAREPYGIWGGMAEHERRALQTAPTQAPEGHP